MYRLVLRIGPEIEFVVHSFCHMMHQRNLFTHPSPPQKAHNILPKHIRTGPFTCIQTDETEAEV